MLHFTLKLDKLLGQRWSPNGWKESYDSILIGESTIDAVRHCFRIFNPLRKANQPYQPLLLPFIFDVNKTMNGWNYWFYFITLRHFSTFNQDQISKLFWQRPIVFAQVLDHIEFSREFNYFFHEGIMSHTLTFSFRERIVAFYEEG